MPLIDESIVEDARGMSPRRHVTAEETATLPHLPVPSATGRLWLDAFFGPAAPSCARIDRALTIGRDPMCSLAIDDTAASRKHAWIEPHGDGARVRDLGSRNGTFVDGQRIETAIDIGGAATLRVGESLFRIARRDEEWTPPAAGPLVGGSSLAMLRRKIALVGPTNLAILVLGATGTGKDVVARLIHEASGRPGAFIAVNCAALPETLVEAELFGHARAAFTGATHARKGLFAAADEGTLFLDEVGDLPPAAQAKLLRVLEDGAVRPVGSDRAHAIDVRVVSATNRDLSEREFRSDLLARLSGIDIRMPPLQQRPEDLPALSEHLLRRAGRAGVSLSCDAMETLALHDWPMNVRELESVLRQAALSRPERIGFTDLPEHLRAILTRARGETPRAPEPVDRESIERALREHCGNVRQACRAAGISRAHMYRLLKRWDLDPAAFRTAAGYGDC